MSCASFGNVVSSGRAVGVVTRLNPRVGLVKVAADDMAGTAVNALEGSNKL